MKIALLLAAFTFGPGFAFAGGCHGDETKVTASSCKDGAVWDEAKGICVLHPSS